MDIKENLAKNLIIFRKAYNLTQAELAEKINYSDKAISKWERGEAIPDVSILKEIADLFSTTIDTLISEPKEEKPKVKKLIPKKRLVVSLIAFGLVWLITLFTYTLVKMLLPSYELSWLIFIYAIPVSTVLFLIFSAIWGKNFMTATILSILIWSVILSIYLSLNVYLINPPSSLWLIFIIGIPLQILDVLWVYYKNISALIKHQKKSK